MMIPTPRRGHWLRRGFVVSSAAALAAALALLLPAGRAGAHDLALAGLQQQARARRLHATRTWQVLLHYRRTATGAYRSDADGARFFNAGWRGKHDPAAELHATLAAFARPPAVIDPRRPEETEHPQCRFPARWAWLKQTLGITAQQIPEQPCALFARWRQAFSPERVTLVFASSYLASPASIYGHTFLRLSRASMRDGEGGAGSLAAPNPLLDYIINFAADADTSNGFIYATKGLLGGFKGQFYVMPYYMKIQEYSNIESRDLWEYELSLTPPQAERLLQHAWETRSTHFEYFFFSENCSYFLLELLEAAVPSLRLTDEFPAHVIPADTVRAVLAVPGLVVSRWPRPALLAQLSARRGLLSPAEIAAAERLAAGGGAARPALDPLPPPRQALVLDAASDLLRYREGLEAADPGPVFARKERELLVLRGRTGQPPAALDIPPAVDAPEVGHATLRVALGGGAGRDGTAFGELGLRLALHDRLDPPPGYTANAALEMLHVRLRLEPEAGRVYPERVDLVNIVSVVPHDSWAPQQSWRVRAGARQAHERGCGGWDCLIAEIEAGGGTALRLGRAASVHGMAESAVQAGGALPARYAVGLGAGAGLLVQEGRRARSELEAAYHYFALGERGGQTRLALGQALDLTRRAQLRLVAEAMFDGMPPGGPATAYAEARLELHGYF
jgi:hypothetical protein